jgi:hypothetical protein
MEKFTVYIRHIKTEIEAETQEQAVAIANAQFGGMLRENMDSWM